MESQSISGTKERNEPLGIEDYALIGDCISAALVGRDGSVDWLCWPNFDSDACFAALLGDADNGHWRLSPAAPVTTSTRHYLGETMILETLFETDEGAVAVIDFMPIDPEIHCLVRRVEGRRGHVPMRMEMRLRFEYGSSTPWVTRLDGELGFEAVAGPSLVVLRTSVPISGEHNASVASFDVAAGECIDLVLSWGRSHRDQPPAVNVPDTLATTQAFWQEWADRCQYTGEWRPVVLRSLLTLKALSFAPTGAIVAAPTTSLPEQLGGTRNWDYRYCWLRDATLTLVALMAGGYVDEAANWRDWLHRAVAGNPDELQIMYGIGGERRLTEWSPSWLRGYQGASPVRIGNAAAGQLQLDTYGEVMGAMHLARRHGLQEKRGSWDMQILHAGRLEKIWDQPDDGIWEIRGDRRHFTHSKVMAWLAIDCVVRDAEEFGFEAPVERWRTLRSKMHRVICEKGFDEKRNSFTQSFGSPALDASLLMLPQVGFLPIDDPRIAVTVKAIEAELLVDGFVLRYRTEGGSDGLPPGEGAFLPCSFWLASVYQMQGRHDEARGLFKRLTSLTNDLGLLSEEYDPGAKRLVGNFPQAYSHLALIGTALTLDGIRPEQARHGTA